MASAIHPSPFIHPSHRVMVSHGSDLAWLLKVMFVRPLEALPVWIRRTRERMELAAMDDLMRRDLGVSPALVEREVNKPVWQH